MKILHVIPAVAPRYGGPSQAIVGLCRALRDQGLDVEMCTTDADGDGRLPVELGKRIVYQGIPSYFFRRDWTEAFKYSRSLKRWVGQHVDQYDMVHIHGGFSHATYAAARACHRRGIPYIVRPFGTLEPWSMHHKRPRKFIAWHAGFRRVIQAAIAIHYTTEQERMLTENSLNLRNGIVVPNGVDESVLERGSSHRFRQELGLSDRDSFLLTLSRVHPQKGIEFILQAFVDLKVQGHLAGWHLVIAGSGEPDYVRRLQGLAHQTSAESFVHWVGWLQGESKQAALSESNLFVLSSFQESFGIGVLEAMACATPVLISRHVGLASTIEAHRAGWVVNLNSDELRTALLEATQHPAILQARGEAARQLVAEEFVWSKIAVRWTVLYDRLLTGYKRGATSESSVPLGQTVSGDKWG
ncbi:MAG TPA: glycosyltransferase [Verrucomicrobiae bacterium]|nr:glycosyltransferase [Verrucomicrobiae bacterium]